MTTRNLKAADISAFPQAIPEGGFAAQDGMTLRDWFAGQALSAFIAKFCTVKDAHELSAMCYAVADAMMSKRAL